MAGAAGERIVVGQSTGSSAIRGAAQTRGRNMNRSTGPARTGFRRVVRAVGDGTGRSEEEVVVLAAVAATAAVTVAVWRGVAWAVETLTNWDPWPTAPRGTGG
jgi:hypothetical protein